MATQYPIIVESGETLSTATFLDEIARLAEEIRWHEEQAQADARRAISHKIEIGRRLIRAKEILDHGEFIPWTKREFPQWDRSYLWRHMNLAANVARVQHLAPDVSWRQINKALNGDAPDAIVEPTDAEEDEPDAMFWGARDGLLALRDAAQTQANRFGLKYHAENLTRGQLRELRQRVRAAADAVARVGALLDTVRPGRVPVRRPSAVSPGSLGPQQRSILEALREHGRLTSKELSPLTSIPVYVLSGRLSEMAERGLIARTGQKRGGAFEYVHVEEAQP